MPGLPMLLKCFLMIGWTMASSQADSLFPSKGAETLGDSVCNLSPNDIETSGKDLLKQLSQCPSFTPDQVRAIQAVLHNGETPFGPPSEWSSSTLDDLRGLFHLFDRDILKQIPRSVLIPWVKDFLRTPNLPRELVAIIVENLKSSRRKRAAECPPGKTVTQKVVEDITMPLDYTPEELRACLKGPILEKNLGVLTSYAFAYDQLVPIKNNLDELFPDGYPESIIGKLGGLVNLVNADDVKKWKFTSPETLASLMNSLSDDKMASAIIKQYLDSGGALTSQALDAIGSQNICHLTENQLNQINEAAIKGVKPLNLSSCNQATKNILYSKAKKAFSDQENNFPYYYNKTKPYLGGAPIEDLRDLSKHNVNMDINTFMGLRPDSIMGLTPNEVKGLLGRNLKDLAKEQDNFPIKDWIRKQKQSALNNLGIGQIRGGEPEGYINIMPRT